MFGLADKDSNAYSLCFCHTQFVYMIPFGLIEIKKSMCGFQLLYSRTLVLCEF